MNEQLYIKLYLDEMIPPNLAEVLRQYGYDVVTAQQAGMLGKSDLDHLKYATAQGRAILTFNTRDFVKLHQNWFDEGKSHGGDHRFAGARDEAIRRVAETMLEVAGSRDS